MCKHEDLSLIPRTCFEKQGVVVPSCNPSAEDTQIGRPLGLGRLDRQASKTSERHLKMRNEILSQKTKWRGTVEDNESCTLPSTCT